MATQRMRSVAPIRDIVHDYMPFTPFEREVIDSPYFQRLHSVLQNSSAYVTYPCNRNTRFAHSLGVAFLAGKMFCSGLSHATRDDLLAFIDSVSKFFLANREALHLTDKDSFSELERVWAENIGNVSGFSHLPFIGLRHSFSHTNELLETDTSHKSRFSALFIINTLFLAVRMAGLFHDIGHLPTSHVFEHALLKLTDKSNANGDEDAAHKKLISLVNELSQRSDDYIGQGDPQGLQTLSRLFGLSSHDAIKEYIATKQIHETRGLFIMNEYYGDTTNRNIDVHIDKYRKLLVVFARLIIACPDHSVISGNAAFIPALKQLIDSELDADRLDYTMRDPLVSGLEFGQLDTTRIIDNIVLAAKFPNNQFSFCLNEKAVSNVEQMFHQRALGYQNLIYHRGNVRSQAVIESIIFLSYKFAFMNQNTEFCRQFAEFGFVKLDNKSTQIMSLVPSDPVALQLFDDTTFRVFLTHIIKNFDKYSKNTEYKSLELLKIIHSLAEAFVYRRYDNIKTLFRNETDRTRITIDFAGKSEINIKEVIDIFNSSEKAKKLGAYAMFATAKARTYKSQEGSIHKDILIYECNGEEYETTSIKKRSKYLDQHKSTFDGKRNYYIFLMTGADNSGELITEIEKSVIDVLSPNQK